MSDEREVDIDWLNGEVERLRAERDEARADVERLNNLLRARGFGQGEIDNDADLVEQLAQAQAALRDVGAINSALTWIRWEEEHAAALKAAREANGT